MSAQDQIWAVDVLEEIGPAFPASLPRLAEDLPTYNRGRFAARIAVRRIIEESSTP